VDRQPQHSRARWARTTAEVEVPASRPPADDRIRTRQLVRAAEGQISATPNSDQRAARGNTSTDAASGKSAARASLSLVPRFFMCRQGVNTDRVPRPLSCCRRFTCCAAPHRLQEPVSVRTRSGSISAVCLLFPGAGRARDSRDDRHRDTGADAPRGARRVQLGARSLVVRTLPIQLALCARSRTFKWRAKLRRESAGHAISRSSKRGHLVFVAPFTVLLDRAFPSDLRSKLRPELPISLARH